MIDEFLPVVGLMEEIGRQIVSWRTSPELRQLHSIDDFKTEADRRAHDFIYEGLSLLYPGVEIISEENSVYESLRPDAYWLIDPIDGTASWYHGYDGFVTQGAYIEKGVPIFGIIHAPILKKIWIAARGSGAFLNCRKLPMLAEGDRLIVTDNNSKPHGFSQDVMELLNATGYLESGSLGLKSVLVADGTADLFVKDIPVRDWDIAPAEVMLHEVGGVLILADGSPYVFDGTFEKSAGIIVARDISLMRKSVTAIAQIKKSKR